MLNPQNDIAQWNAFKAGSRSAFEAIFRTYYPALIQYGSKICTERETLEDAIQDLFIEIWQSSSNSPLLSVKAYLFKALKYKLFRQMKVDSGKRNLDEQDSLQGFTLPHDHFLINREEENQQSNRIKQAIERLPARQREIVYLRIYQGLEYSEISEIMSINYQVARNLFYQSLKSLRAEFNAS